MLASQISPYIQLGIEFLSFSDTQTGTPMNRMGTPVKIVSTTDGTTIGDGMIPRVISPIVLSVKGQYKHIKLLGSSH